MLVQEFIKFGPTAGFSFRQCEAQLKGMFTGALKGKNKEFLVGLREVLDNQ